MYSACDGFELHLGRSVVVASSYLCVLFLFLDARSGSDDAQASEEAEYPRYLLNPQY